MAVHEEKAGLSKAAETQIDPQSLSLIERIFYYEHLDPMEADNDNKHVTASTQGSACFDSWAMPDYMRR